MHAIAINRSYADTIVATVAFSGARQYRSATVYAVDRNSPRSAGSKMSARWRTTPSR